MKLIFSIYNITIFSSLKSIFPSFVSHEKHDFVLSLPISPHILIFPKCFFLFMFIIISWYIIGCEYGFYAATYFSLLLLFKVVCNIVGFWFLKREQVCFCLKLQKNCSQVMMLTKKQIFKELIRKKTLVRSNR